jgi:hypothetical protein
MNDLNSLYIDSEAVLSDHSQSEGVIGMQQVNTYCNTPPGKKEPSGLSECGNRGLGSRYVSLC